MELWAAVALSFSLMAISRLDPQGERWRCLASSRQEPPTTQHRLPPRPGEFLENLQGSPEGKGQVEGASGGRKSRGDPHSGSKEELVNPPPLWGDWQIWGYWEKPPPPRPLKPLTCLGKVSLLLEHVGDDGGHPGGEAVTVQGRTRCSARTVRAALHSHGLSGRSPGTSHPLSPGLLAFVWSSPTLSGGKVQ